ncbi:Gfo/Idh/MocA family oxidoreductase [Pontiella sulfatireligans]|uniref:Scyllo-inositol 2-dehydrogenase (NADP(+)) n=1 Tax=Pontiella sulfatireligans TaxID=2750658 RepID=A0A6C2UIP3_9BACT|nr:Gfo/Idh/MocA family oxidoreductase [Pontiella sulfatireligans]VGO19291.1 scyllo-inositol 2-dehydrogenase (NADP(+)) [Pontiella sulfatireligans]
MTRSISRRNLTLAAGATASISLIPGRVLGANGKVNVAAIGIGGRGGGVIKSMNQTGIANFVALCDVALGSKHTAASEGMFPDAKKFTDYRVMFDQMANEIDAVLVCIPDFSHFPASMTVMSLGKHVYVEKPMARTFQEVELMMRAEKKYGVVTQMGNQGHSDNNYYQFKAWKEAGIIKDVTHVDAYMNKGRRWHPWGDVQGFPTGEIKPENLDWNLWKGTTPKAIDYSNKLHPGNWRGWHQFGTGCFGDWGAHILDTIHQFLDLGLPETISAKKLEGRNDFIFPMESTINFAFPARNGMPSMDIDWYDGKNNKPPVPEEFAGRQLKGPGKFIYSKEYIFQGGSHGSTLQVIPYEKMRELLVAGKLPKDFGKNSNHYMNFLKACRGEEQTNSPFSVAGPLTQVLNLGCIAQHLGGTLEFDRKTKQITNNELANSLLQDDVRKGWEQYYKL